MLISREVKMLVPKEYLIPELVRLYLKYEPDTGFLIWIRKPSSKVIVGSRAGCQVRDRDNRIIKLFGEVYIEHRLIWFMQTGKWPLEIDHINHNEVDNRWCNLREVTHEENTMNCSLKKNNTSGCTGVQYSPRYKHPWTAVIECKKRKVRKSKSFYTFEEAVHQRKLWEKEYGYHENHGIKKPQ